MISPFPACKPTEETIHATILRSIRETTRREPRKKAFINGHDYSDFLTYEQLEAQATAVCFFLEDIGFRKEIACTVIPTCHEFAVFFLGVIQRGGTISGASALFTEYELERQLTDCDCSILLTHIQHLSLVQRASRKLAKLKAIIVVGASLEKPLPSGCARWENVLRTRSNSSLPPIQIDLDRDVALLPYSSGTTGVPKGVKLTHRAFGSMLKIMVDFFRRVESEPPLKDVDFRHEHSLVFTPSSHVFGFGLRRIVILGMDPLSGVLSIGLCKGITSVLLSKFEPRDFCRAIQEFKIKQLSVVPPTLVFLAKSPVCDEFDLSSLRLLTCGAAPAGRDLCFEHEMDLVMKVQRRHRSIQFIQQSYGMTEASIASHLGDARSRLKPGSVGKIAPALVGKIIDPETGAECPPGVPGEICVKGPTIMLGYRNRPEATRETIKDGWLHTGDIGYVDDEGDHFIVDRLKELIKVKGFQVPPAELEDLLLSHPLIADAAVIGVPDKDAGELPRAFVVRHSEKLTEKEVQDFVKGKVSPYKELMAGVVFINEIPKAPSGKILRRFLRDSLKAKL